MYILYYYEKCFQKFKQALTANADWGPSDPETKEEWIECRKEFEANSLDKKGSLQNGKYIL